MPAHKAEGMTMATALVERREQLGEKQKLLSTVFQEAGQDRDFTKVKCLGDDLDTMAKVEKVRALNKELTELADECRKLEVEEYAKGAQRVQDEMSRVSLPAIHPNGEKRDRSVGEMFVESEEYQVWQKQGKGHRGTFSVLLDIGLKTLFQTTAGWAPESTRIGRVIDEPTRPIQALDLIPVGQTDQAAVVYMEETTRTHAAAEKAEGVAFAESAFVLTEQTSTVRKITDSIPVTDEQLEDVSQVRSYLDMRLRFGVRQRLDNQVINGDGVAPNLEGILNATGIQTQAKGTDPTFDAIHKAMTKIRVTGRANPSGILLHPNDWEAIRLTTTADGIYIMGNPSIVGPMTLFGLPVAVGDVIVENTGLVGDFATFCALFERRGINLVVGFSGTQFAEGKALLRADMRAAFVVFRPAAFATVTGI